MQKYLYEFLGTFFLLLVISFSGQPLAIGAILTALVYLGGEISGAYYNPAVTGAAFINKKIPLKDFLLYFSVQTLGALFAALTYFIVFGKTFVPVFNPQYKVMSWILIEFLFTFLLAFVALNVTKVPDKSYTGVAVGLTLLAASFAGSEISGAVINPAISIGTWLVGLIKGNFSYINLILYLASQFLGGLLAGFLCKVLNNKSKKESNLDSLQLPKAEPEKLDVMTKSLLNK